MHKPQVKAHYATQFNEIVQHDLFFLFGQTFMLLIDECIKYKMGDHIIDKRGPTKVRALYKLWIRVWGPPQNLLSDQEGGLLSNECTRMFVKLNINRLLVGTGGSTTKGLVERHIALTKTAMLKLQTMQRRRIRSFILRHLLRSLYGTKPDARIRRLHTTTSTDRLYTCRTHSRHRDFSTNYWST